MPIPTVNSEILLRCLERDQFVFVETTDSDVQDVVESVVCNYCNEKHATYTDRVSDVPDIMAQSLENRDTLYVVYVRDWQRFSGNDIMLRFNTLFEADLKRCGPDSWCAPEFRHQSMYVLPGGRTVQGMDMFQNVKVVFSGTDDPLQEDPGLQSRLLSYRISM